MAKISMIHRDIKRAKIAARDTVKREALKAIIINEELAFDERMAARDTLNKLPRDGAKIRGRNRCQFTGRPRGYHRKFGVSRIALRKMASEGLLPGVKKASW